MKKQKLTSAARANLETIANCYEGSPFSEVMQVLVEDFEKRGATWQADFLKSQLAAHQKRVAHGIKANVGLLRTALDQSDSKLALGKPDFASMADARYNGKYGV